MCVCVLRDSLLLLCLRLIEVCQTKLCVCVHRYILCSSPPLQVILTVMDALEKLLLCDRLAPGGPVIGRALVPYYRQILPVMNIFLTANTNRGDGIEYGQRHRSVVGDRILGVSRSLETASWG